MKCWQKITSGPWNVVLKFVFFDFGDNINKHEKYEKYKIFEEPVKMISRKKKKPQNKIVQSTSDKFNLPDFLELVIC